MKLVVLGLSITSSWGNGHATTYRALLRAVAEREHQVTFLERNVPWYAAHRDLPTPPFCNTSLYESLEELERSFAPVVRGADVVMIGSYVPDGVAVADWVFATARGLVVFYDIDTPVTLAALQNDAAAYLGREQVPRYDIYFSFTGGPTLRRVQQEFGGRVVRPLYCCVDPELYYPESRATRWDLGYMGTYSPDRQPALERLLLEPAQRHVRGRYAVAGPQYPEQMRWPPNVTRHAHLEPRRHRSFYNAQRFTLNLTRADMVRAGYSPSVRLFEAAACGTPVISDAWTGLDSFFDIGREIIVAETADDVVRELTNEHSAYAPSIGAAARRRVLAQHTAQRRAHELESYLEGISLAHSA